MRAPLISPKGLAGASAWLETLPESPMRILTETLLLDYAVVHKMALPPRLLQLGKVLVHVITEEGGGRGDA